MKESGMCITLEKERPRGTHESCLQIFGEVARGKGIQSHSVGSRGSKEVRSAGVRPKESNSYSI